MLGGMFFWVIFYALAAAAIFLGTLTSFDRRLGRIDDAASWLCLPSRPVRFLTALYAGWSVCFALFMFMPAGDSTFESFGSALLFVVGLLLLSGRAAWPLDADRSPGAAEVHLAVRRLPSRLLMAKWASAGRLVPGVLILPLMVAFNDNGLYLAEWAPLVILLVFMFSVSLAAVSLGVAMFAWLGRSAWSVVLTIAIWGLVISEWFTRGNIDVLELDRVASIPTLPFSGVARLCLAMRGSGSADWGLVVRTLGASACYVVAAVLLYLAAHFMTSIRSRRAID
jgi:hypothetical protein